MDSLLDYILKSGSKLADFSIVTPDGEIHKVGKNKDEFQLQIKSNSVYKEAILKGSLGLGEQYMLGNIDIKGDLHKALVTLLTLLKTDKNRVQESLLFNLIYKLKRLIWTETKNKALKDISAHYDISNDFYQKFLDPTMTYSCAYFEKPSDSLEKAQIQKYEHICRKLLLKPGETLVDIGCGWGGMLIYAAQKYKVRGYGVTLSKNQYEYANKKIEQLKLTNQVKIELKDYRDITGKFDKFVSIGMFEHVTEKYYDDFFRVVENILKPGGVGVLHTIGIRANKSAPIDPWYENYIFPGSQLPSTKIIMEYLAKYKFEPQDFENLRLHYALTLKSWIDNYMKHYDDTVKQKGEKFARMWLWYLALSRATFTFGISQLYQFTFTKGNNNEWPLTRKHLN